MGTSGYLSVDEEEICLYTVSKEKIVIRKNASKDNIPDRIIPVLGKAPERFFLFENDSQSFEIIQVYSKEDSSNSVWLITDNNRLKIFSSRDNLLTKCIKNNEYIYIQISNDVFHSHLFKHSVIGFCFKEGFIDTLVLDGIFNDDFKLDDWNVSGMIVSGEGIPFFISSKKEKMMLTALDKGTKKE